jgi:hypothetical protein
MNYLLMKWRHFSINYTMLVTRKYFEVGFTLIIPCQDTRLHSNNSLKVFDMSQSCAGAFEIN